MEVGVLHLENFLEELKGEEVEIGAHRAPLLGEKVKEYKAFAGSTFSVMSRGTNFEFWSLALMVIQGDRLWRV